MYCWHTECTKNMQRPQRYDCRNLEYEIHSIALFGACVIIIGDTELAYRPSRGKKHLVNVKLIQNTNGRRELGCSEEIDTRQTFDNDCAIAIDTHLTHVNAQNDVRWKECSNVAPQSSPNNGLLCTCTKRRVSSECFFGKNCCGWIRIARMGAMA